jgi:flagellar hook-associated protein 1 FlgK
MVGITSLFEIGKKSLLGSQSAIQVTGNNISNANTPGYSRQRVRLEDGYYISTVPGQIGTGVQAAEVLRDFDEFVELQYLGKSSEYLRWDALRARLQDVEGLFNEANTEGLNTALAQFFAAWQDLAARPEDNNVRTALLAHAQNLQIFLTESHKSLEQMRVQADLALEDEVKTINGLLRDIAELNIAIQAQEVPGSINANGLRDQRASLVRKLAERMDIVYVDNGGGNVTITTKAGQALVSRGEYFELKVEGAQAIADVEAFTGSIGFAGSGDHEYLVRIVQNGGIGGGTPALFQVSVDGGRTWLADENGVDTFAAQAYGNRITVPDGKLEIWFAQGTGPGAQDLRAGDVFQIVPHKGVYWYENSSSKMNITPRIFPSGQEDTSRVTGGSLAGICQFRDFYVGRYGEKLDSLVETLAWEVNRIHSQGTGLDPLTGWTATNAVRSAAVPLGGADSGLVYADKLAQGNITVSVYTTTGQLLRTVGLDFDSITPGQQNFSPTVHTLEDVRAAFHAIDGISATIVDGRLRLQADPGHTFAFGDDSTGLLAALGINTFFDGSRALDFRVNETVGGQPDLIASGHVNGAGERNPGDNTTAKAMAALQQTKVAFTTTFEGTVRQTIQDNYSSLVALVGADVQNASFNSSYHKTLADELARRQDEVSGVNLDEEMTNLIKFQHAYAAAAKLISTSDAMLQTLLGMKN